MSLQGPNNFCLEIFITSLGNFWIETSERNCFWRNVSSSLITECIKFPKLLDCETSTSPILEKKHTRPQFLAFIFWAKIFVPIYTMVYRYTLLYIIGSWNTRISRTLLDQNTCECLISRNNYWFNYAIFRVRSVLCVYLTEIEFDKYDAKLLNVALLSFFFC